MALLSKDDLKVYFQTDKRPSASDFEDLIDSSLNILDDKASDVEAEDSTIDNKFITPKTAKKAVEKFAPVKKVNNIAPDSNGNITITNVNGSASTITGAITKSQVTGLESDLNNKQNILVSGTSIKTINGLTILGSGDLVISSVPNKLIGVLSSNFTLSNSNVAQNAFPTNCDEFTLSANKSYFIRGKYLILNGTLPHTTAISWLSTSGLSINSMEYVSKAFSSALNGISTASSYVQVNGIASKILNAISNEPTTTIEFEGVLRNTTGGVLTPQLTFSAAPGGTNQMKIGSFIELTEIGSNTVQTVGSVN